MQPKFSLDEDEEALLIRLDIISRIEGELSFIKLVIDVDGKSPDVNKTSVVACLEGMCIFLFVLDSDS